MVRLVTGWYPSPAMRPVVFEGDGVDLLSLPRRAELVGSVEAWQARHFSVVCAGEAIPPTTRQPRGGAVEASVHLAARGMRVGLVAALDDEARGRAMLASVKELGVDVDGVALVPPRMRLVLSDARRSVPLRPEDEPPLSLPDGWTYELLLLSGLGPGLLPASALCRAARAARRTGALVVVDLNARRALWSGRDVRQIHAILREADVVRCSTDDLLSLWTDTLSLRAAMRSSSTLVCTDGPARAVATGPFGEVVVAPQEILRESAAGAGDAFTAAMCHELLRAEARVDWERVLRAAHAAAHARIRSGL